MTIYEQAYCHKAEAILANGKSLAAVCAQFNIARSTLYEWRDNHPEFKKAIDRGLQKAQCVWEDIGEDGARGDLKGFSAPAYIFTMKNRFREDYAEDKESKNVSEDLVSKILDKLVE